MSASSAPAAAPSRTARLLDPPHARALDARRDALPAPLRPDAALGVLDVTKWFGTTSGGVRTYLLQKAAYVAHRPSLRHTIVVPGPADRVGDAEGTRCYQVRSLPVPRRPPYRVLTARGALHRIARHERPSIIEAGSPLLVPWLARGAARELGAPLVCFHHGVIAHNVMPDAARAGRPRRLLGRATWRYLRRLDRLFAMTFAGSEFVAEDLRRHGIERVEWIPLGVELELFTPARRARRAEVRRALGLPEDALLAGFIGRFSSEKQIGVALEAWPAVARATGATLVLVGAGAQRAELEQRAAGQNVRVLPYVHGREALADLHAALDVYLATGPIETFGLSSLEAMASGTPVLSVNRGAVVELVQRSGAGALYEAGDAASLAGAMIALLGQELTALGARGRAYAEREHAWDAVFDRLFATYERVLRDWDGRMAEGRA